MKECPIIFSGLMVRAILDGRKSQTRRIVKPQPNAACNIRVNDAGQWEVYGAGGVWMPLKCPYGKPGDRLYVKERHRLTRFRRDGQQWVRCEYTCEVDGDCSVREYRWIDIPKPQRERLRKIKTWGKWRPGRFMYRFLAHLWLEVTGVRVERVQDITATDTIAEGVDLPVPPNCDPSSPPAEFKHWTKAKQEQWIKGQARATYFCRCADVDNHFVAFEKLWDSLNAKRGFGWETNPWVWVIEFKRVNNATATM